MSRMNFVDEHVLLNLHQYFTHITSPLDMYFFSYPAMTDTHAPLQSPIPLPNNAMQYKLFLGQILSELSNEQLLCTLKSILTCAFAGTGYEWMATHLISITPTSTVTRNASSRILTFFDDPHSLWLHTQLTTILPCIYFDRNGCFYVPSEILLQALSSLIVQFSTGEHVPRYFCNVEIPNSCSHTPHNSRQQSQVAPNTYHQFMLMPPPNGATTQGQPPTQHYANPLNNVRR